MHEASVTESIVSTVLKTLEDHAVAGEVKAVNLTVGVCQGLVPESVQMFFDMMKEGTRIADAELIVTTQGMVAHCPACDEIHELDIPVMHCPECGLTMTLEKGNEVIITSIEVEE